MSLTKTIASIGTTSADLCRECFLLVTEVEGIEHTERRLLTIDGTIAKLRSHVADFAACRRKSASCLF